MNAKLMFGALALSVHDYKIEPKSRFTPGTMKIDGVDTPVKVTGVGHAKFPAYTYWRDATGALKYVQGDFRDKELKSEAAAPAANPAPAASEPPKSEAKPLPAPVQHGKRK